MTSLNQVHQLPSNYSKRVLHQHPTSEMRCNTFVYMG
jgi:hypothetical protein